MLKWIKEAKEGQKAFTSRKRVDTDRSKDRAQSAKSRVRVYKSIMDALRKGQYGQMFSTVGSDRLYVLLIVTGKHELCS